MNRLNKTVAAATALLVAAALILVATVVTKPAPPGPPAQRSGTAAGRPHRVPASATIATLANDRVVHAAGRLAHRPGGRSAQLPAGKRPKGAVPPAPKPPPVRLGKRPAGGHDRLRKLRPPAAPHVAGFSAHTSRVLDGGTSADRVVYRNADGTRTAMFYQTPVNYRRPDGSWARINTSLVPVADRRTTAPSPSASPLLPSASPSLISPSASPGTFTPVPSASPATSSTAAAKGWRERAAADPETFAPDANASPLMVLSLDGQDSVGLAVRGTAAVAGTAHGDTVTYPGARPDADLRLVAGAGMVDAQLILHSAGAPDSWTFPLRLHGLKAVPGPGGIIEFVNAPGKPVAFVAHATMTDSKINPHSGDGATSAKVSYTLTTADGLPAIRMTLDKAWLNAPSRVFPVTVDPSVGSYNSNGTTYAQTNDGGDHSGETEIHVGTYDGGSDVARSFLKFDSVSSSLANDTVLGVRLGVFNSWSYSCSPRTVNVYPVTSSWTPSGVTSYPGPSTGRSIGSKSFATGWVPLGSTVSPCPSVWEGINLNEAGTQLVNGWTHGTTADNGLALGASPTDSYGWKKFTSINTTNGAPFLSVTYTPYGASYDLASSQPVQQVSPTQNGEIAIKVTNTGSATWTPTNGYELSYELYNSKGKLAASHPVFTPMPSSVAPGHSVTVDAKVNELPVGSYAIDFDMYANATTSSPVSFLSQGIAPFAVGLYVPQPPPVVTAVYPPTGYVSPTVTPQLSTTAFSTTKTAITYQFALTCQPLPGSTCPASSVNSPKLTVPYWTTTPLSWDEPYTWTVTATTNGTSTTVGPVSITPEVPQPAITSGLGSASGQAFDPQSGDFTTNATDAAVSGTGPPLEIDRAYNSVDPRSAGAFGAGWSSVLDASVLPDSDGSGNMLVTLPDGQQMRFGNNGTGTYSPPMGSPDTLVHNSSGTWTLMDASGNQYQFTSGGQLTQITGPTGLAQTFASNAAGEIITITDQASGRALHLTWSTPAGAVYPHVASVATDPPASGQSGLTWTYSYTGDDLTGVCPPTSGCTSYSYTTGSSYRSAVLDDAPRSYWQFGDPAGSATAADEVDANLGTTNGSYANVTLGVAGPLAASSETAASFNGTSSSASLPANLVTDQNYISIGTWFKAANSTSSGVLFGYQADALSNSGGASAAHVPALYVGGNGKLYGELWNGTVEPMSSSVSVDDGNWHYAVLTGSASSQSLWLDGNLVGTLTGQIIPDGMYTDTAGAGFWKGWPSAYATEGSTEVNTPIGYFGGSIGQLAVYPRPLGQPAISEQYSLAENPAAELTQVTLPSGRVSQQASYNSSEDRIATYTDPHGGQWQIHAPLATGYKATSESLGEVTRYVTVADPAGYDEVYGYDALNGGRLVSFTPGNGDAPETFGYDAAGYVNQVVDSDGNLVTLTNDIHGNVLSRTWYPVEPADIAASGSARAGPAAATSSSCATTGSPCTTYYSYYYDTGNPLDPRNNEVTGVADARSASATDTTYLTSYARNAAGEITSSTTPPTSDFPSGRTTSYAYSTSSTAAFGGGTVPAGLLISQTTPGGAATSYSYFSNGDLAQVTQPDGASTRYTYDGLGRALTATTYSSTYPSGLTTSYTYNAVNQPLTVTYPGVANQVTGVTHTLKDAYAYDADGNLLSQTQSDLTGGDPSRTTTYTYNDFGEVASATYPAGDTTGYSYNDSGQVATMVDGNGNEYDYSYNEYGKVTQITLTTNSASLPSPGSTSLVLDSYAYDPAGLLASATDAMGRTTTYFYNSDEQLVAAQNLTSAGTGRQSAYTYDGAGNLIQTDVSAFPVTSTNQTVIQYNYDAADRLTSMVVDPTPAGSSAGGYANRTTSYTYNAGNQVTSQMVTGAGGSSATTNGYNSAGELTSQAVQVGGTADTTTWTYDTLGQVLGMTSPDGNAAGATAANYTTNYSYDQAGDLAVTTGPPVSTESYTAQTPVSTRAVTVYGYDTFGDQTQVKDPNDNLTTMGYDGDGRVASVSQPSYTPPGSSTPITATTGYAYDGNGNLIKATDPEGNTTSYGYDALGDLTSETDPQLTGQSAPGVWAYTYDNDGEQLSATSPTGAETQATYDTFGDLATTTQDIRGGSGTTYHTTSYTYDYLGDPLTVTTPDGVVTTNTYNHLGELASTADSFGDTTSYAYNYAGQVSQVTNPDGTTDDYGYSAAGNPTSVTVYGTAPPPQVPPVLAAQTMGYDPSGNLTSVTDPDNVTTSYSYDAAGDLTSQTQPVTSSTSDTTQYGHDPAGNQTSVTDARGNTTWTTYNSWNLPESVIKPATATATTPAQRTWTTAYNADGLAASVSQPGGITQSYGYDQVRELTSESGSGAAAPTTGQTFGYDTAGDLTSASAPGGTDAFSYNDAGELTATSGPSGTASFGYNGDGLMTSRTDAAGTTSYTYDKAGRLATTADPLTGATLTYGYNADSLPASVSYAKSGTAGPTESLGYNGLQQLTSDTLTSSGGATIASASYGYNADGDMTSQATTGYAGAASTSYGYDEADWLTSATTGGTTTSYGYDATGDLTQAGGSTYTYNAQDQPVTSAASAGTTSYSYTLSGALSSVTPPSGTAQNYTSNAYGQTVTAPGGISYAYDALGRLATRTTSSGTASFAYSGAGGTVASDGTTSYSYDPAGDPVAAKASGGTAEAALTDVHGDVTGMFSPAAGTTSLAASAAYSPYGAVTAHTGTMPALGYQGQYTDPATGATDMSARWYSPAMGTFTSSDTLGGMPDPSTVSPTPYGYAGSNPLTTTDPTGHWGCVWTGIFSLCLPQAPGLNEGSSGGWSGQGGTQSYCGLFCQYAAQSNTGSQYGYQGSWNQWSFFGSFTAEMLAREAAGRPGGGSSSGGWCGDCGGGGWSPGWCSWGCAPPPPPPPPPPPQDCYAGPDPSCSAPVPPSWLRTIPYQSQPAPRDVTNWREISTKDRIREQPPTEQQILNLLHLETAGITAGANENGDLASGQNSGTNADLPHTALSTIGQPVTPPVIIDPIVEPIPQPKDPIPEPIVPNDIIDRIPEPVVPDAIIDPIVPRLPERLINVGGLQGPQIYASTPSQGGSGQQLTNAERGRLGVEQTAQEIEAAGGRVKAREVGMKAAGWRTRVDLYVRLPNGQEALIEVKTSERMPKSPTDELSPNQKGALKPINDQGGVPYGPAAINAGIPAGQPIKVYIVRQPWPLGGLPLDELSG
jgi:RHS repeat-associated protein